MYDLLSSIQKVTHFCNIMDKHLPAFFYDLSARK